MVDQTVWLKPPPILRLGPNCIDLWRAPLDVRPESIGQFYSVLSRDEQTRADRFHFEKDRARFIVSRGVLRQLLGTYLSLLPASVVIANDQKQKPFVPMECYSTPVKIRFNTSHSDALAVFAFSDGLELGVDIESIQREIDFEAIAESHFTNSEKGTLQNLSTTLRREAFFMAWTRKEAYLKCLGDGLSAPLSSFDVRLELAGDPISFKTNKLGELTMYSFHPAPGHAGALVAEGTAHILRFFRSC